MPLNHEYNASEDASSTHLQVTTPVVATGRAAHLHVFAPKLGGVPRDERSILFSFRALLWLILPLVRPIRSTFVGASDWFAGYVVSVVSLGNVLEAAMAELGSAVCAVPVSAGRARALLCGAAVRLATSAPSSVQISFPTDFIRTQWAHAPAALAAPPAAPAAGGARSPGRQRSPTAGHASVAARFSHDLSGTLQLLRERAAEVEQPVAA